MFCPNVFGLALRTDAISTKKRLKAARKDSLHRGLNFVGEVMLCGSSANLRSSKLRPKTAPSSDALPFVSPFMASIGLRSPLYRRDWETRAPVQSSDRPRLGWRTTDDDSGLQD